MNLLRNPLIDLPQKLFDTDLYKLLKLLDDYILKTYQFKFEKDDEFPAIKEALKYFYKSPERTDEGELDEEAKDIDLNYLAWIVQSGKSTRQFSKVLFNGNFNLETEGNPLDNFVRINPEDPMSIIVTLKSLEGETLEDSEGKISDMLNHLLYFHSIEKLIEEFTQVIRVSQVDNNSYFLRNINSIYYDCGNRV